MLNQSNRLQPQPPLQSKGNNPRQLLSQDSNHSNNLLLNPLRNNRKHSNQQVCEITSLRQVNSSNRIRVKARQGRVIKKKVGTHKSSSLKLNRRRLHRLRLRSNRLKHLSRMTACSKIYTVQEPPQAPSPNPRPHNKPKQANSYQLVKPLLQLLLQPL